MKKEKTSMSSFLTAITFRMRPALLEYDDEDESDW